jgi:hypothetical protein
LPSLLSLERDLELLGRLVGVVSLRADFSHPGVLRWLLLVEDEDDIAGHSLVGDDDLLATIDDEIAALIKSALLSVSSDLSVAVNISQLAELGADHHRDLTQIDSDRLKLLSHTVDLIALFNDVSSLRVLGEG